MMFTVFSIGKAYHNALRPHRRGERHTARTHPNQAAAMTAPSARIPAPKAPSHSRHASERGDETQVARMHPNRPSGKALYDPKRLEPATHAIKSPTVANGPDSPVANSSTSCSRRIGSARKALITRPSASSHAFKAEELPPVEGAAQPPSSREKSIVSCAARPFGYAFSGEKSRQEAPRIPLRPPLDLLPGQ